MCNRFFKYFEKFSCLSQGENDESSIDEHSANDSKGSRHSSENDDNSYQEDSFKSYSEEESSGEDVVESTGRRRTRSSTYEDRSSKATGSAIENTEAKDAVDQQIRKKSPVEKVKKHVKLKVESSPRREPEVQDKSPELNKNKLKQTHKELPRNSSRTERLNQEGNLKKPPTMKDQSAKQKDGKRSNAAKQDEKATTEKVDRLRKSSLKVKQTEKNVIPNRDGKTEEKFERERKSIKKPEEKPKNEEKKKKAKIPETLKSSNKKSTPNNQRKSIAPRLPKISTKKLEPESQMSKPTKSNSTKIRTFSKGANKSLSRRNVPAFATKSIAKRRL